MSLSKKKEGALWAGAIVIAVGALFLSWDWLASQKPAPPVKEEVAPGQEAFGDSD